MIQGLKDFVSANPGRAATILVSLVVVIAVIAMAVLYQSFDTGDTEEPPYPQEVTPLSLAGSSVVWTMPVNVTVDGSGLDYGNISFYWEFQGKFGRTYWKGRLGDYSTLNMSSTATVEFTLGSTVDCNENNESVLTEFWLVITDVAGDGRFNIGDTIKYQMNNSTAVRPLSEDTEYTYSLRYIRGDLHHDLGLYSCAVHAGTFYTWISEDSSGNEPWWVWLNPSCALPMRNAKPCIVPGHVKNHHVRRIGPVYWHMNYQS